MNGSINKPKNKTNKLYYFIVLYQEDASMNAALNAPLQFHCQAEDSDHAEEQCQDAYPDCIITWIEQTDTVQAALDSYYDNYYKAFKEGIEAQYTKEHPDPELELLKAKSCLLESLLMVINKDKDGDYFICKEASDIIQEAYSLYTQDNKDEEFSNT